MIEIYNGSSSSRPFIYRLPPVMVAAGVAVGCVAAGLGALNAVPRMAALAPAEAMRPEPPGRYRRSWLERADSSTGSPHLSA